MNVDRERYEEGLRIRREVLGTDHVDRSLANASDFSRSLQELVTEYCWGTIWARPGLDRRVRSLLNIALLAAMNRQREMELHVHGALRNGCTEHEIQEVLLQVAVYCGVPTALDSLRTAEAAIRDHKQRAGLEREEELSG